MHVKPKINLKNGLTIHYTENKRRLFAISLYMSWVLDHTETDCFVVKFDFSSSEIISLTCRLNVENIHFLSYWDDVSHFYVNAMFSNNSNAREQT